MNELNYTKSVIARSTRKLIDQINSTLDIFHKQFKGTSNCLKTSIADGQTNTQTVDETIVARVLRTFIQ